MLGKSVLGLMLLALAGGPSWAGDTAGQSPIARADSARVEAGGSVRIAVLANDGAVQGRLDPARVTIVQPPFDGRLERHDDGSLSYTPDEGFSGIDGFLYRVEDERGRVSKEAPVIIRVQAPHGGNLAPLASATASSVYAGYVAAAGNDADLRSYWLSNYLSNFEALDYQLFWDRPRRLRFLEVHWAGNYFPTRFEVLYLDSGGAWRSLGWYAHDEAANLGVTTDGIRLHMTNDRARYNNGYLGLWEVVVE